MKFPIRLLLPLALLIQGCQSIPNHTRAAAPEKPDDWESWKITPKLLLIDAPDQGISADNLEVDLLPTSNYEPIKHNPKTTSVKWFRLDPSGMKFDALSDGSEYSGTDTLRLRFMKSTRAYVGYYALLHANRGDHFPDPLKPNVLNRTPIYHVQGAEASKTIAGALTIWGTPLAVSGNYSATNCSSTVACPGSYQARVDFNWGWNYPTTATTQGKVTFPQDAKVRYWRSSPSQPVCGCDGLLMLPPKNSINYTYTFTLYLPAIVTGSQSITVEGLEAVPPQTMQVSR